MRRVLREGVRRGRERLVAGVVVGLGVDEVFLQGAVEDAVARGAGAVGVGLCGRAMSQAVSPMESSAGVLPKWCQAPAVMPSMLPPIGARLA